MISEQASWLLGWGSCVLCLIFTLRCAFVFAKNDPYIFLALTIYAAQWGLLIVYYSSINPDELHSNCQKKLPEFLPALSGYLCAIVGVLIYRNSPSQSQSGKKHIFKREAIFAFLLLSIALPSTLQSPFGSVLPLNISHEDIEVFVTLLLKVVGFYSMYKAVNVLSGKVILKRFVNFCLLIYVLLESGYTFRWLYFKHMFSSDEIVMNVFFLVSFSVVKLLVVFSFIPLVLTVCRTYRRLNSLDKVLHFLHIEAR